MTTIEPADRSRVRVVLAHGASGTAASMRGHVEGLRTRGVEAFAIDLPKRKAEDAVPAYLAALAALPPLADGRRLVIGGHSYGAFVALQHAVDFPGAAAQTIVSSGIPSSRFLAQVEQNLQNFEPIELRRQVADSWARESSAETQADFASIMRDQMPFHFADPRDPRIAEYHARTAGTVYAPQVLKHFAQQAYGGIEVEDRLGGVTQPVLVLAGRYDRVCSVEAGKAIAAGIPDAQLVIFERSAHMTFAEEQERYLMAVRDFLDRTRQS